MLSKLGGMPLAKSGLLNRAPILITSFRPWKAHQVSNSSDDLLAALHHQLVPQSIWLRQVPVSFQMAPILVTNEIYRLRPRLVICCGMAEGRSRLALEAQAKWRPKQRAKQQDNAQSNDSPKTLTTSLNLSSLLTNTRLSEISYDAGDYVCNHLYYNTLEFIKKTSLNTTVLFIHIPVLSSKNKKIIMTDFLHIYSKLSTVTSGSALFQVHAQVEKTA